MAIMILIIAFILEVALCIYGIRSKDNQNKLRSKIRIAVWLVFVIGALTSIVEWGFRWYSLFALLSIYAIIGGFRLWKKTYGDKPYKKGRIILKGISTFALITFAAIPGIVFPQYKLPAITGELEVKTASYTFTDLNRMETFTDTGENRKVNIEFWYPEGATEKYPLIVFSHGAFGVKMSNTSTFTELASNGYVVVSIDHSYHAAGTMDADGHLTIGSQAFMQEVINANSEVYTEQEKFELYSKWMTLRTEDMNFVLDEILEKPENTSAEIYNLIDKDKIGLMGHSLGGAASAQLGRDRKDISAVIDLDGSMLGEYRMNSDGVIEMNEEPYPLPILNFYSEYVMNELKANPEYVYVNQYMSSISSRAFETTIKGSNHMSYTDLPLFSPFLASQLSGISGGSTKANVDKYYCIETMNKLVLEFFNSYIKNTGEFTLKEFY